MSTRITAFEANRNDPGAHCCNCGECAGDAPEEQIWFVVNGQLFCPKCAKSHGVDE